MRNLNNMRALAGIILAGAVLTGCSGTAPVSETKSTQTNGHPSQTAGIYKVVYSQQIKSFDKNSAEFNEDGTLKKVKKGLSQYTFQYIDGKHHTIKADPKDIRFVPHSNLTVKSPEVGGTDFSNRIFLLKYSCLDAQKVKCGPDRYDLLVPEKFL